jgi:hypothetical protein
MAAKASLSAKDMGTLKIVNMGNGSAAQDAATYGQVQSAQSAAQAYTDTQLAGVVSGQTPKGSVRAAVGTNVNIAAPGSTLDGLAAANGDIFWLYGQTTGTENGPYQFNGAAAAMTRASNWDTQAEAVLGSYWTVREGTQADKFLLLTNDAFTLGVTTAAVQFFSALTGGAYNSFATNTPAITAGATGTITHNLNSRDVGVAVVRAASPYDEPDIRVERTTVNTVSLLPDVAIASGEFRVLVWKIG